MRKLAANFIFSPGVGLLKNGILELDDDNRVIKLRDTGGELREEAGLEFYNGIICPGFVNAHCHLELSHMKGYIRENIGLDRFIYEVVTGRGFSLEEISMAADRADREMQREGIVAVGDISNKEDSFRIKSSSEIYYHTFIEIFNLKNNKARETFLQGKKLLETCRAKYSLNASLVPHAAYSVSEKLFELFRNYLDHSENILSIHNMETQHEDPFIAQATGNLYRVFSELGMETGDSKPRNLTSFEWLTRMIPKNSPVIFIHNTYLREYHIRKAGFDFRDSWFCLCPNSNIYIDNVLPEKLLLDQFPDKVCIGTDSLSSNHHLSIISELITLSQHYSDTGIEQLLTMACINGAKALGISDWAGSFDPGKRPGVNLVYNIDLKLLRLRNDSKVKVLA